MRKSLADLRCSTLAEWVALGYFEGDFVIRATDIDKGGYPRVLIVMDGRLRSICAHIVVARRMIGRPLLRKEVVHHKNQNKLDYRPENLKVMLRKEHQKLHMLWRRKRRASSLEEEYVAPPNIFNEVFGDEVVNFVR